MDKRKQNSLTDKELVSNILSGHRQDFSVLISNTQNLVSHIVFKMINNPEERKDIVQDVYLKVYSKLYTFKFKSKLSTWIGQIAYNTCLNHLGKKSNLVFDQMDDIEELSSHDMHLHQELSIELESRIYRKETKAILEKEIENLPPLYRTLITLFHTKEMSYKEIGQITNLPEGTIKNYLYRARKKLREGLLLVYQKDDL